MPYLTIQDSEPSASTTHKTDVVAMVRAPRGSPLRKQLLVVHDADMPTDGSDAKAKRAGISSSAMAKYSALLAVFRPRDRADAWAAAISAIKFGTIPRSGKVKAIVDALSADLGLDDEDSGDASDDDDDPEVATLRGARLMGTELGPLPSPATFEVLPAVREKERHVTVVAGASGSGKSTWIAQHCQRWADLWPDRKIFLLSKLPEDEVLDSLPAAAKPKRINIQSLVDDPIDEAAGGACETFANSLVIADDVDSLVGAQKKAVHEVLNDLVTMGRHQNISVIVVLHLFAQGKETSRFHLEANRVVLFPHGLPFQQMFYAVKKLWGLDEKTVHGFLKLGRWVCLSRSHPQWLVSEHTARLLIA